MSVSGLRTFFSVSSHTLLMRFTSLSLVSQILSLLTSWGLEDIFKWLIMFCLGLPFSQVSCIHLDCWLRFRSMWTRNEQGLWNCGYLQ